MRAIVIVGVVLVAGRGRARSSGLAQRRQRPVRVGRVRGRAVHVEPPGRRGRAGCRPQVDEYRAFCLYALGRTREAESVAESIIRKEPLARLDAADASPRLESMFSDVRKRLLPSLIRERFRVARSSLDLKSFAVAEPYLVEARLMIVEAEKIGVRDEGLADLSILVDGFLQLIRSAATQRPPPAAAVAVAAAAPPAAPHPVSTPPPAPEAPRPAAPSSAPAAAMSMRVYSVADEGVNPPVTIEQRMPAITPEMQMIAKALKTNGMIDVVVDETGRVVDATIRQSLNASFDTLIVRTARNWRYRPAMKDGVPVRYLKTLVLVP